MRLGARADAVLISTVVGIAAAARGISLIVGGFHERTSLAEKRNA